MNVNRDSGKYAYPSGIINYVDHHSYGIYDEQKAANWIYYPMRTTIPWIPLIGSFAPGEDCKGKVTCTLKSGNIKT